MRPMGHIAYLRHPGPYLKTFPMHLIPFIGSNIPLGLTTLISLNMHYVQKLPNNFGLFCISDSNEKIGFLCPRHEMAGGI
jgi:hypothetical protein